MSETSNTKWIAAVGAVCLVIGATLGVLVMRGCADPEVEVRVDHRIDTLKARPDTVKVQYTVTRYIERPLPEPTPDSTATFWIELLWRENIALRLERDSCRGLELEAVTENDRYALRQHFSGSAYWERGDAKSAMAHELIIRSNDTTRTEIQPCPNDWWRTAKDYLLVAALGYTIIDIIIEVIINRSTFGRQ